MAKALFWRNNKRTFPQFSGKEGRNQIIQCLIFWFFIKIELHAFELSSDTFQLKEYSRSGTVPDPGLSFKNLTLPFSFMKTVVI